MELTFLKDALKIMDIKTQQMERQRQIDTILAQRLDKCSREIATLLLEERKYHQAMAKSSENSSLIAKVKLGVSMTSDWETRYNELEKSLETGGCKGLRKFIKRMYNIDM